MISEGGGVKLTALNPIMGADRAARFFIGTTRTFAGHGSDLRHEARMVNGALGVVSYLGDELERVMSLCVDRDLIAAIYIVRNPLKLAHLAANEVSKASYRC